MSSAFSQLSMTLVQASSLMKHMARLRWHDSASSLLACSNRLLRHQSNDKEASIVSGSAGCGLHGTLLCSGFKSNIFWMCVRLLM
jgi:hypothetical protein